MTFDEDGYDSTCRQIIDLAKSFAIKGKGDDTSIAGFIDMDRIKHFATFFSFGKGSFARPIWIGVPRLPRGVWREVPDPWTGCPEAPGCLYSAFGWDY